MKKQLYTGIRMYAKKSKRFIPAVVCAFSLLSAKAQTTYYSNFPTPVSSSNYSTNQPSCIVSTFPVTVSTNLTPVSNVSNVADADLTNYASLDLALLNSVLQTIGSVACNPEYRIRARLNLTNGVTPNNLIGYYVGFRAELSATLGANLAGITLNTYLNGGTIPVQTYSGSSLLNVNLLGGNLLGVNITQPITQAFNEVELVFEKNILNLNVNGALAPDPRFYYAYASSSPIILPVKLTSFSAAAEGKNVQVSWTAAQETNVARYEVERSDARGTFTTVGSVAAKGNSAVETNYSFTDRGIVTGEYLYRLKTVDRDGTNSYSKIVSVKNLAALNWNVYPTLLSKGTDVQVSFASNGIAKSEVRITGLQGQTVSSFTAYNGKLSIPTASLASGIYTVKLYQNGQPIASRKIVIQ
jgi:hypothetical protein